MFIIDRIFKPLDNLIDKTEEIIFENLNEKIPITANDEVGELSMKFNVMLDLLNENMETIKESSIQKQWLRKIEFQKIKTKNIELKIIIKTEYFYEDEHLILVVLTNLIDNAINASKDNSIIEAGVYSEDDKTIIKISDQGQGIDSQDLPYIFQPLYKSDKNRSAIYRGAGLGLSLSKKIIELHDVDIEIKSQKNTRTEIYISLKTI